MKVISRLLLLLLLLGGIVVVAPVARAADEKNYYYGTGYQDCKPGSFGLKQPAEGSALGTFCVQMSSNSGNYQTSSAPANGQCPVLTSADPRFDGTRGVAYDAGGGQTKCFYNAAGTLETATPSFSTATSTAGSGKCGNVTVGTPGLGAICGGGSIFELVGGIANYLLGLIGALAVLAIIVSGIQYIVSQGNPDAVKKAKSRIVNAVVGLVLLALTAVIMNQLGVA